LLDEQDDQKVHRAVLRHWTSQEEGLSRVLCEVEQAERWREGERWVYIRPGAEDREYEVWRPPGVDRLPPMPDKIDELVRRLVAQMTVDAPKLKATPATGEEADQQAAAMASRLLEVEGGEAGWNIPAVLSQALDRAMTQKSAFAHVTVDPKSRQEPVTVLCHPAVQVFTTPEQVVLDPATGIPTADVVRKYLNADGSLTEQETATTVSRWVPELRIDVLGTRNVRFLPEWCEGLSDADGVLIADYKPIGWLKRVYPDTVGQMDAAQLRKLVGWEPEGMTPDDLLPAFARDPKEVGTQLDPSEVPDDAVALVLWAYYRQSPVYPKGAVVCIGGDKAVLHRGTLERDIERPDGTTVKEVAEPPVSHLLCLRDTIGGSPYGVALVTKLGPWNELMAQQWTAVTDWLDRFNHPLTFIPLGSTVQPGQIQARNGDPILVNPDGAPVVEAVPPIPPVITEWYDRAVAGMDSTAIIQSVGQGLAPASVNSGRQAEVIIQQAMVGLASMRRHAVDFLSRLGRILLQQCRATMTVPQTLQYVGDDASYRVDEWRGADLYGATDVIVEPGSLTMLDEQTKRQMLMADMQMGLVDPAQAKEIIAGHLSSTLGLEDDPVRLRIKRQIDACLNDGAPFDALPVDEVPAIAAQRFRALSQAMMTTKYRTLQQKSPQAAQAFDAEWNRMRMASGTMTLAEQQQAQQAAQQAQMQAQAQAEAAKQQATMQAEAQKSALRIQETQAKAALTPVVDDDGAEVTI
jgi:hypothetical protein